jgi:hypothetical protein
MEVAPVALDELLSDAVAGAALSARAEAVHLASTSKIRSSLSMSGRRI